MRLKHPTCFDQIISEAKQIQLSFIPGLLWVRFIKPNKCSCALIGGKSPQKMK